MLIRYDLWHYTHLWDQGSVFIGYEYFNGFWGNYFIVGCPYVHKDSVNWYIDQVFWGGCALVPHGDSQNPQTLGPLCCNA